MTWFLKLFLESMWKQFFFLQSLLDKFFSQNVSIINKGEYSARRVFQVLILSLQKTNIEMRFSLWTKSLRSRLSFEFFFWLQNTKKKWFCLHDAVKYDFVSRKLWNCDICPQHYSKKNYSKVFFISLHKTQSLLLLINFHQTWILISP
jgi:hypothetical protein